jgi:hypothetical protein
MHPAAAIGHRRLAAGAARPRARAAARHRREVAGGIAVAQPAGAGRGSGAGRRAGGLSVGVARGCGTAAALAAGPALRAGVVVRLGPIEPDILLDDPLLAPELVQRHHPDAIAFHHARHDCGEPRRLDAGAIVRRSRSQLVDHPVEPRRQPHDQPVADRELMPEQRSQRTPDSGRLRRRGGELAGAGGDGER